MKFGAKAAACIAAVAAILVSTMAGAEPQTSPPIAAFAVLPPEPPQISPDGTRFAVIRGINGRPAVAIYKVDAPTEPPQIVTSDDWILAGMTWVKNDVLIIYSKKNIKLGVYDRYREEMLRPLGDAVAVSLKDNKQIHLTAYARIVDVDLDDPDTVYAVAGNSLYAMNVRTGGRPKPFVKEYVGPENAETANWFLDGHGKVIARVDMVHDRQSYEHPLWHDTLKVFGNDTWRALANFDSTVDRGNGVEGLSEDGTAIIRLARDSKTTVPVKRIDIASGAETTLFQDPTYDVDWTLRDDWTGRVVGYVIDQDMPVFRYFDPKREALQRALEQAFAGLSVHAVSSDVSGDRAIVETVGPRMPASYYLFDHATHRATAIVAGYPDLNESDLGEVKPYAYLARDGLRIPAYLTFPPGRKGQNLPLVVIPHGGPDARDDMQFDFLSQFLASRGYAVLRPEFRGSSGYGRPFTEAGLHQWGLKMQDDISDGVRRTIADGIADPKRVCIFGASYGGYAALAGATLTPDVYACVISLAGISSLPDLLGYSKKQFGTDFTNGSFTATRMGDIFSDSAQLDATSPVLHADRVKAPILLLHSELDVTVPIQQSEIMAAALTAKGKKVRFVRIDGDDHYLSLERTRYQVLQEAETFLAASIGNPP